MASLYHDAGAIESFSRQRAASVALGKPSLIRLPLDSSTKSQSGASAELRPKHGQEYAGQHPHRNLSGQKIKLEEEPSG